MASGRGVREALCIVAASERDADLYYATRFLAPDPFVFLEVGGRRLMLTTDLELRRARTTATVDRVLPLARYEAKARRRGGSGGLLWGLVECLREWRVRRLTVPEGMPVGLADGLRARGFRLEIRERPFFPERLQKSRAEVRAITEVLRLTEEVLALAIDRLRQSTIRRGRLFEGRQVLTAEILRRYIHQELLARDCYAEQTVVASGRQGADPHGWGHGPLRAHTPIVLDIFPRSGRTRYFGDITRTVVRGTASTRARAMYRAVHLAQEEAFRRIRDGVLGAAVHREVCRVLEAQGFKTKRGRGGPEGFFHGTGHGLGLEIHEPPRVGPAEFTLRAGQVVTVEPGLYYPRDGGVRLEDVVVVGKRGIRNLTRFPKYFELT
ncbi:MAG: M24 family metallopeptidase [Candidatus Methylomirabilales bacterium]